MTSMSWTAVQAMKLATKRRGFNPHPPGLFLPDSTTDKVYRFLRDHPGVSFRYAELLKHTGVTPSALNWAVSFLVAQRFIGRKPHSLAGRLRFRYVFIAGVHRKE